MNFLVDYYGIQKIINAESKGEAKKKFLDHLKTVFDISNINSSKIEVTPTNLVKESTGTVLDNIERIHRGEDKSILLVFTKKDMNTETVHFDLMNYLVSINSEFKNISSKVFEDSNLIKFEGNPALINELEKILVKKSTDEIKENKNKYTIWNTFAKEL